MRFWEIINEAVAASNLLFHAMDAEKALNVFETDQLEGRFTHYIGDRKIKGFSCTRNSQLWFDPMKCVRVTLDRSVISASNKIAILDINHIYSQGQMRDRELEPADQLQEEFVIGNLNHIHRAITQVAIRLPRQGRDQHFADMVSRVSQWGERYGVAIEVDEAATKWLTRFKKKASR